MANALDTGDPSGVKAGLEAVARNAGIPLFGVADLSPAADFVKSQGSDYLGRFPRAISLGFGLSPAVVDGLGERANHGLAQSYHEYIYGIVNPRLNEVALRMTQSLASQGHLAYLVPASQRVDQTKEIGLFSHKLAAHLAGLGFIGRGCLLVTPAFGARVRFATILTDAPLPVDSPIAGSCGECRRCVDSCPVHAFTGAEFRSQEPREARMNAGVCGRYLDHRHKTIGRAVCGICVYVCDGQAS